MQAFLSSAHAQDSALQVLYIIETFFHYQQPSKAINGSNIPAFTGGQGIRMYVEESDSEMDLWISVSKGKLHTNPKPRILVMTITVVKKNCRGSSRFYRQCPHSPYCIRREFFCDGRVNCAWPDAEAGGTDEVQCDAEGMLLFRNQVYHLKSVLQILTCFKKAK